MRILPLPSLLLILLLSLLANCRQEDSPHLAWPDRGRESKPWSRWWWPGNSVTKAGITAELEACQKAGLGGLELTPIYGVIGEEDQFIDYLSPRWVELLEYTLGEADRLGLGIDMATGTGWPFGGPWVGADDASRYLTHKTFHLTGGERLAEPVRFLQEPLVRAVPNPVYQLYGFLNEKGVKTTGSPEAPALLPGSRPLSSNDLVEPVEKNANLQALALDQVRFEKWLPLQSLMAYSAQGAVVDLTEQVSASGQLNWTAPPGTWTLYAVFQGWHGKMVERAAPGGEGYVIDHFSETAIRRYLARFDSAFAGRTIHGLRAFFNDSYEVDDARGQADWTPKLLTEFQQRRGYDLREHWPALFGEGPEEERIRVLSDYRETISDLLLETFTRQWAQWAHARGAIVRNQAHGSPANILDLYAASDIPETEGTDMLRIKFATSAAHVAGRPLASSESATWLNEHFLSDLADLKANLDRFLAGGVNHVFYHGTCYSPPGKDWPGRLFYAAVHANPRNPLWRDLPALNRYIARTQAFLQSGKPDNDVLLYFPIYDRFAAPGRALLEHFDGHGPGLEGSPFETDATFLQAEGYAFDFISDRQIRRLRHQQGQLETGGVNYRTIVLTECRFIPLSTFEKVVELAKTGATVIVHKALPADIPGWGNREDRRKKFQALLDQLPFQTGTQGIAQAKVGKGICLMGDDLDALLTYAGVKKETLVARGLEYTRRRDEGGRVYFLTNRSEKDIEGWILLQSEAGAAALFDPMNGQFGLAKFRPSPKGGSEVFLQLPRGSSCIVQTFPSVPAGKPWTYYEKSGAPIALKGSWTISGLAGGPALTPTVETDTLGSWTDRPEEAFRIFSGTARYTLAFPRPEGEGWLLDLGAVHESAQVRLNGHPLATLIGPTFRVIIDRSRMQERNTLEIDVTNLMANRIADLDRRGVFWKRFYNVNFPARRPENRGKDGLFDASGWKPLPSGLIGPVTLTRVTFFSK